MKEEGNREGKDSEERQMTTLSKKPGHFARYAISIHLLKPKVERIVSSTYPATTMRTSDIMATLEIRTNPNVIEATVKL